MIERLTDYEGYLLRFRGAVPSESAVLFFHGLPAHRGLKNLDLADCVFRSRGDWSYVLHFRGLGESRGAFGFVDSIREGVAVAERLSKREGHRRVHLVGHSWGGLVALNAAVERPDLVSSVTLLSPLCHVADGDPLIDWLLNGAPQEWPGLFGDKDAKSLSREMDEVGRKYLPSVVAPRISPDVPVTFLQAAQDDVTPAATARSILGKFPSAPDYRELPFDHSFTGGRRELAEALLQVLARVDRKL